MATPYGLMQLSQDSHDPYSEPNPAQLLISLLLCLIGAVMLSFLRKLWMKEASKMEGQGDLQRQYVQDLMME